MSENLSPGTFRRSECVQPEAGDAFCVAVEEGEAWLLGDISALKAAYPRAKEDVLHGYQNDAICGTWELLADAVFTKGAGALEKRGSQAVGREKSAWAEKIAPHMNVDANASPQFPILSGQDSRSHLIS